MLSSIEQAFWQSTILDLLTYLISFCQWFWLSVATGQRWVESTALP
jgi:hypothetical protein